MEQAADRKERSGGVLDLRLIDLYTTVAVLRETIVRPSGARRRVAAGMGLEPSVVTDRVKRVEKLLAVKLFDPVSPLELTRAGQQMADQGHELVGRFVQSVEALQSLK